MIAHKFILIAAAIGFTLEAKTLQAQGGFEGVISGGYRERGVYSLNLVGYLNNGTVGWAFSSAQDIVIESLGELLGGTNAPATTRVSIGLWAADGTLLRSAVIDNDSVPINGSLYTSVSPLFVSAGSTLVVGAGLSGGPTFLFIALSNSPTQFPINFAGTASSYGNGLIFPTVYPTDGDTQRFIPAATFLFQPVPEPSALALSALGTLILGFRRWWTFTRQR